MGRSIFVLLGVLLGATLSYSRPLPAPPQTASSALGRGSFPVIIAKTLDSSKLKEGESIELETTGSFKLLDGTLVPKGSKLTGHVTSAKARSKGDFDSRLALSFETLGLPGAKQISLKGSVQALYPPAEEPQGPNMATAGTSQGGSGAGASPANVGITNGTSGSDTQSESNPQSVMNLKTTGVQGLHGLSLENGVISSKGKNIKLGGGVRIVVNAEFLGYSSTR
jgi:hypothetical protein